MKTKLLNTIFISLALFAIYLTVFYSKEFYYAFDKFPDIYEYVIHIIIISIPTLLFSIFFIFKNNNRNLKLIIKEKGRLNNEKLKSTKLQDQISNYVDELARIHEKYINLSSEADMIMIEFNAIIEKFINNEIEQLDRKHERKDKLVQQMFYDLANPIRMKLTSLKTITASAIKSLRQTEEKNDSIKKELQEIMENSLLEMEKQDEESSKKDNIINSLKEKENKSSKSKQQYLEKLRNLEIKNQVLETRLKQYNLSDNELLFEIEKLRDENSELLNSLDKIKPFRKKYSK
jgi:hypothetical protein